MTPLDRKLLRDLWRMKGQAVAIALVIALGVLMLVMMDGLVNSLEETKRAYYERYRLADIYAPIKRAANRKLADIAALPGVAAVRGRIAGSALIDVPGVAVPVRAQAVSLPENGRPRLNDIYLTDGRMLDPTRDDEILIFRSFAHAHNLKPGTKITATLNGARRTFTIAGLADAPEFLNAVPPGELAPDDTRFAVIWMNRSALASALDLKGAFNEALISLTRDGDANAVKKQLDTLLASAGSIGAYLRQDHISDRFVSEEIKGLKTSSTTVPPVFLGVAAFLLYIVISRMIQAEREEIGLMKAFGYSSWEVARHYGKFVLVVAIGGALLGCLLGVLAGRSMVELYLQYFKFPFLVFQVEPRSFVIAVAVSVLAASAGGFVVLRGIFKLTPAVAMRPPAPPDYSKTLRLGARAKRWLDQPSRMVVRRLVRQPMRALAAIMGIAAGMALSVGMLTVMHGFDDVLLLSFSIVDRSDATVTFVEPLDERAIYRLQRIPGVIEVEPFRAVPVILRNGLHTYRGSLSGLQAEPRLNRVVDANRRAIYVRSDGVILGKALADILKIGPGGTLTVEVREGRRPILQLPIVAIAETLLGAPAFFERAALNRALKEPNRVSGAYLRIDQADSDRIYRQLKDMPIIAGVSLRNDAFMAFKRLMDQGAGSVRYVMAAIAAIITFGIVYNSARIAFAERARDLASLRVIGFSRAEAAFVLMGELAVITVLALPLGSLLGYGLARAMAVGFSTDLYQIPATFSPEAVGIAVLAVLAAAVLSGLVVKRDIDQLDLVAVLKTRE